MATRILLVDDFGPWRCFVRSLLVEEAELEIIGEAPDGMQAVQRSDELKPDLILLDIGLPNLNGIAAAQETHEISPIVILDAFVGCRRRAASSLCNHQLGEL
jgi:chemotaxis response regulator CheB